MDRSRLEILPKVWLDYRRAIFLEEHSLLAVADLHLGYAWGHRYNGQMLPFGGGDRLIERLIELCSCYKPATFALLGDLVHQAVPVGELVDEFESMVKALRETCATGLIIGNHDKRLRSVIRDKSIELFASLQFGKFLLVHGDSAAETKAGSTIVMGHEHPAISLGDGIKGAKFPCFLVSEEVVILPAFSLWAAGSDFRSHAFMSALARGARFSKAVAICGHKLLPIPLWSE
jgi:putative SbcD/Mre11-related phosphoesterase